MFTIAGFLLALTLVVAVALAARRALVIFELQVSGGKITRARGRISQALLNDLLVVCPRGRDDNLTLVCRAEAGRARLTAKGALHEDSLQRMRNIVGLWPLARLKSAPKI